MTVALCFFQIPVADTVRARTFYGELFGWQFAPGNFPDYFMIPNATPVGALAGGTEGSRPEVFFTLPDIDAGVARVRELGGFAACRDDQGTHFFVWQDAS